MTGTILGSQPEGYAVAFDFPGLGVLLVQDGDVMGLSEIEYLLVGRTPGLGRVPPPLTAAGTGAGLLPECDSALISASDAAGGRISSISANSLVALVRLLQRKDSLVRKLKTLNDGAEAMGEERRRGVAASEWRKFQCEYAWIVVQIERANAGIREALPSLQPL